MDKREFYFTLCLVGIAGAALVYSMLLPRMGAVALSPGLFPGVVSALLIILSGVHLFHLRRMKGLRGKEDKEEKRSFLVVMSIFLLYLLLLSYIHFIASTALFLFVTMIFLYRRFYWKIPIISAAAVLGIYYLFRYFLNVRLP
jgi:putative tricarboxylic transport membrane protein